MSLFDSMVRTDTGPAPHFHNSFEFYNANARDEVGAIRSVLNSWFESYPSSHQADLKNRLRKDFSSPFFELFVHELFRRQGFTLEPHPTLAWSAKRPEFLATGKGVDFYIEAKEITGKSDSERSAENMASTLYDQINLVESRNFFVWIRELVLKSGSQPSGKAVQRFMNETLPKYGPDAVQEQLDRFGLGGFTDITYEDDDLKLVFALVPKKAEARGKLGRLIGIYPSISFFGNTDIKLRKAIDEKGSKYGSFDKPFLICVNVVGGDAADDDDVYNALFGTLKFTISKNPANREVRPLRESDGVFFTPSTMAGTNVSAVLITRIFPSNLHTARHWLVKNPNAKHELDLHLMEITGQEVVECEIIEIPKKTIRELFELSENWLD